LYREYLITEPGLLAAAQTELAGRDLALLVPARSALPRRHPDCRRKRLNPGDTALAGVL
jgi:hypothetical protein